MIQFGDEKVIQQLHKWLALQKSNDYVMKKKDENHYQFITDYAIGELNFYDIGVMELMITSLKTNQTAFYLHFEMVDFDRAKALIKEMVTQLIKMKNEKTTRILLCCTGGLTTGYFASKLNEASEALGLDYQFDAVSYTHVYSRGFHYDGIFLAPQIEYELDKIQKGLDGKLVAMIPPAIFAQFNPLEMVELVKSELEEFRENSLTKTQKVHHTFKNRRKILVIAYYSQQGTRHLSYRYYKNGRVEDEADIIKDQKDLRDIEDIIQTTRIRYPEIEEVVLALPGRVSHSLCLDDYIEAGVDDIIGYLRSKYNCEFTAVNHINATAYGYASTHEDYDSMIYYYQPMRTYASSAVIYNGEIVEGKNGITGEYTYLNNLFRYSDTPENLVTTPEGTLEYIIPNLMALILSVGPEKLLLHGPLIPDVNVIYDELKKRIPEDSIPEIKELIYEKGAMFIGAMLYAVNT